MSRWYLDTSAALKLIGQESESAAFSRHLDEAEPDLVGCSLLETEMRRAVPRNANLTHELVSELLDRIDLIDMPPALFRAAAYLPGTHLRSLDAIHLAAAIEANADYLVTYDVRMQKAAQEIGLGVLSPA